GPDRKRTETTYSYRLTHRDLTHRGACCVMAWEVQGGRTPYQVALERDDHGNLHLHCTCADAIYRAEEKGRFCKHVRGLLEFGCRPRQPPVAPPTSVSCVGA